MRVARIVRIAAVSLLAVALVGSVAGVGAVAWITARAMPDTNGTIRIAGLDAAVSVRRDAHGFAQITATTPHDLFLAQGFVHASERMWQMEVWRHISAGRLSEMFGPGSLERDRFVRTLGWRQAAERDLARLGDDARTALEAYAAGVNAWLGGHRDRLGLAFVVTGVNPEPWTPLDTVAWGKVQAWTLGGNMDVELFRYLADARLGDPARTDELLARREFEPVIAPSNEGEPEADAAGDAERSGDSEPAGDAERSGDSGPAGDAEPADRPAPSLTERQAAAWRDVAGIGAETLALAGIGPSSSSLDPDRGLGSNDWVVAPPLSSTGGALLANDPHLGISMPSVWYVNGLHCAVVDDRCPYDVIGVTFPGVPGVILGHNHRIAWGATNADPDVQDLVIETADPADPGRYLGPDGSFLPLTVRSERIEVKGGDAVTVEVRETVHGPLLNDVDERLADAPLMALRWTGTHPDAGPDRTIEAFLRMNAARDFDEFREALALYGAPAQNFVYADVDGHIGYQLPGWIPVRSDPDDRGLRPVSGSDGRGEWTGRVPFDELPSVLDPVDGWIVTANNAIVDDAYPGFIGADWDPGYRAGRIIDLINGYAQDGLTVPEMGEIQLDTAPPRAEEIAIWLGEGRPDTPDGATIAARIGDWDGACEIDSLGCAAYMTWEYLVLRGAFDDELGPLARDYVGSPFSWVALGTLLGDPTSPWWDDTTTSDVVETADLVVLRAMDRAGAELRAAFGDPSDWIWGRLHTATFREATIGTASGIGPLEWYYNEGPYAVPGAAGAIDNAYYQLGRGYPDPSDPEYVPVGVDEVFGVTVLPSYRLLIDMSDLDGARVVTTTGQSGHPFDRHYNDLIEPWSEGTTLPLPFGEAAIAAATVSTLTLEP